MKGYRFQRCRGRRSSPGRTGCGSSGPAGFALLAVLWVLVAVAVLGSVISLAGRQALAAAHNRINLTKAAWLAEDCVQRGLSAITAVLVAESLDQNSWRALDRVVPADPLLAVKGCELELRAAGTTIDVNTASERVLRRLLELHDHRRGRVDSLVAALLDWRDPDDLTRLHGAEYGDYEAQGRHPPRDGPLADIRELHRVRGWADLPGIAGLVGVEPDRICLNHAPLPVLASLPGFSEEAIARLAERRFRNLPLDDLLSLSGEISVPARDSLLRYYPELVRLTVVEPDAWIIVGRAESGIPAVGVSLEIRLVRAGSRTAIVRRRSWIS
jgi:type II secretory pathway component PulK